MKNNTLIVYISLLLNIDQVGRTQGFVNLNYENATITTVSFPGGDRYTATIPGWSVNTPNNINGDPNSIGYNDISLSAPAVNMEGTNFTFPSLRAIQGNYSIFLQGGSTASNTNGATISQTGQIALVSQTLTYWGSALQASFNGQVLSFIAISNAPNFTVWAANITAFAGQTGQLSFTAPWQTSSLLDNIQFSSSPIPEPNALSLSALGGLFLGWRALKKLPP